MKKTISIAAVICLLLTSLSLPAMATDTDNLASVLSNYVVGEAVYTNTFDTADKVTEFGDLRAKNDGDSVGSVNGELKVTHIYNENDTKNVDFLSKDLSSDTASATNKVIVKFTLNMDNVWRRAIVRMSNAAESKVMTEMRINSETGTDSLQIYNGGTLVKNYTKGAGNNTFIMLLDYDDDTYSLWLNTELENITSENALCKNYKFRTAASSEDTFTSVKYFRIYAEDGMTTSGSWTMDDFAIYPLEEPEAPQTTDPTPTRDENVEYLYNENFTVDTPGAVLGTEENSDPYGYVTKENINDKTGTDNTASNAADMSVTEAGELQIVPSQKVHCWYFGKTASDAMSTYDKNLAISMKVKSNVNFYIQMGTGANASVKIHTYWHKDNGALIGVERPASNAQPITKTFANAKIIGLETASEILFLIDKNTDTYSLWLDGTRLVTAVPMNRTIETYDDLQCINFRANATGDYKITVDDIKVYAVKDDDFLKVENTIAKIQEVSNICTMGEDTLPTDLKSNSEIAGDLGCSVEITDSKGYVSDNGNIIFPLFAEDTTDITVKVTKGSITSVREFTNVTMPAAYTFGEINWGTETPKARSQFDGVIIPATVRNAASDNGRLFIAAALFDNTDGSQVVEKIGVQTDTLAENGQTAEGFPIILDLTNLDELPASSLVKVFLWDENMVPFGTVYEKAYTIE